MEHLLFLFRCAQKATAVAVACSWVSGIKTHVKTLSRGFNWVNSSVRVCHRLTLLEGWGNRAKTSSCLWYWDWSKKNYFFLKKKKNTREFLVCRVQTSRLAEPCLTLMKYLLLTLQVLAYRWPSHKPYTLPRSDPPGGLSDLHSFSFLCIGYTLLRTWSENRAVMSVLVLYR